MNDSGDDERWNDDNGGCDRDMNGEMMTRFLDLRGVGCDCGVMMRLLDRM